MNTVMLKLFLCFRFFVATLQRVSLSGEKCSALGSVSEWFQVITAWAKEQDSHLRKWKESFLPALIVLCPLKPLVNTFNRHVWHGTSDHTSKPIGLHYPRPMRRGDGNGLQQICKLYWWMTLVIVKWQRSFKYINGQIRPFRDGRM